MEFFFFVFFFWKGEGVEEFLVFTSIKSTVFVDHECDFPF